MAAKAEYARNSGANFLMELRFMLPQVWNFAFAAIHRAFGYTSPLVVWR
jgi:hypothetical protein